MYSWVFVYITFHLSYRLLGQSGTITQNGAVTLSENNASWYVTVTLTVTKYLLYKHKVGNLSRLRRLGASFRINMFQGS